jgi:ribose transport system permease protein
VAVVVKEKSAVRRIEPLDLVERFGLLFLFAVVIVVFSVREPETFATPANWRSIAISQSVLAVAALAFIFPLIGGRFDVSVGSILGLCSIVTAAAMGKHELSLVLAILIGVGVGALIGLFNGILVAYLGVNSIIGTLGVATVLGGLVLAYTEGIPISEGLSPTLTDLSVKTWFGIPVLFVIMILISIATWFVLTQTPYGRYLAAVGSNLTSARLTGMPVNQIVMLSFVASGLLAGVAGVLQIAAQGNGNPQVGGIAFVLPALAAVFLGATTWRPGTFNVFGTILALFFLGATVSGLALSGTQPWVTDVFNGAAVVIAIAFTAQFRRRRTGSLEVGE